MLQWILGRFDFWQNEKVEMRIEEGPLKDMDFIIYILRSPLSLTVFVQTIITSNMKFPRGCSRLHPLLRDPNI